ncbi:hypothetical protein MED222_13775 [Vibrio sp. MED222]|nr:hypothetical protein MED222_13775 [Vibrio sp. MED222]
MFKQLIAEDVIKLKDIKKALYQSFVNGFNEREV